MPHKRPPQPSVLVVEDNADVRGALVDLLELIGLDAIPATNGIQALRLLEDGLRPEAILLDLELPFLSGWKLCRQLHGHELFRDVPVIVVTGHDVVPRQLPGARSVLQKPVDPDTLLETLRACLAPPSPSPTTVRPV